jgi:1-acyl-sn-glycerol-3-phosphate acyltransferase
MYGLLTVLVIATGFFTFKVDFRQDITSIFPQETDAEKHFSAFKHLKAKDKIVVIFSDTSSPDNLVEASNKFISLLQQDIIATSLIENIEGEISETQYLEVIDFVYKNLPVFLTDDSYSRLDSIVNYELDNIIKKDYEYLISPIGEAMQNVILRDPLGIGSNALSNLKKLSTQENYTIYDGHIFSNDLKHTLVFISPSPNTKENNESEKLTESIEKHIAQVENSNVQINVFGSAIMSAYNSKQIKEDSIITLAIAIIVIALFVFFVFRKKRILPLMFVPAIFGALFALALIYLIQGTISSIAVGAGVVVMGIALSYSIHVITHSFYVKDIKTLIKDLSSPLTIGSITTVGAFVGLMFTHSPLLKDFGLYASLNLIGTTFFCLIFLPHFIKFENSNKSALLKKIERWNIFAIDKNKWIVAAVIIVTIVSLFFYNKVQLNSDMLRLNYVHKKTAKAEQLLDKISDSSQRRIIFVCSNSNTDTALLSYEDMSEKLYSLKEKGEINNYSSASDFFIPFSIQQERIKRWNDFWNDADNKNGGTNSEKKTRVLNGIKNSALKAGFSANAFDAFEEVLSVNYTPFTIDRLQQISLWRNFCENNNGQNVFLAHVSIPQENKNEVYAVFENAHDVSIIDRSFFAEQLTRTVTDDFNLVLYISSILIFLVLLISYGRIELTLMAFIPMAISWIFILGLMAIFGLEFNVINIILSAFIFGIGDDFSIFMLDGLLKKYKDGTDLLKEHKTAIFFSGFTILVGTGVLVFARHPAMYSLALISVLGILSVILVSFTIQPVLFRLLISGPTRKGGYPYTFMGIINSIYAFTVFTSGCLTVQALMMALLPFPFKRKKRLIQWSAHIFLKTFLFLMPSVRYKRFNLSGENFKKPAVIVANHSSFIDIIMMMGLTPKTIMVTNHWVYHNPIFGAIVRYLDFQTIEDGYENMLDTFRKKVEEGYSITVFPEGTRTKDGEITRFHKGAFYLADKLNLDIIPVVLYGNGMVSSKTQPFFIKRGIVSYRILERIPPTAVPDRSSYALPDRSPYALPDRSSYALRTKEVTALFRKMYAQTKQQFNNFGNPYFFNTLIKNYVYKGPVLEWYMRIKIRMEETYNFFDGQIPKEATVVDVGCGYGPLSYALMLYSNKRKITGIDYDKEKIAVAQNCFLKNDKIQFIAADIVEYEMPDADVFVINDVLHYLSYANQEKVLHNMLKHLRPEGFLIIRDSDADEQERHKKTVFTEVMSTHFFKFNKTVNSLCFFSSSQLEKTISKAGYRIVQKKYDKHSSNVIWKISM